jgi:hypothetical protein
MKIKQFKKSDNAVVGIVASFLIVGLVVAVISVVQTQYVPNWMKEKEAEHMNELADQFAQLKYAIDIHASTKEKNTPISTTLTLGSKELPYLMSVRAQGHLEILQEDFNITIHNIIPGDIEKTNFFKPGIIKYKSFNNYYINQEYIYEGGSVILSQYNGNTTYIKPSFSVEYGALNEYTINLKIFNISSIGNKVSSVTGHGPAPIQTEYIEKIDPLIITNAINLVINSTYTNAWASLIDKTLAKAGLILGTDYTIDTPPGRKVTITFDPSITVDFVVEEYKIGAQIAPGWIEQ